MKPLITLNNEYIFPFLGFIFVEIIYLVYASPMEALIYGVPNAVLWALWSRPFGNYLFFQVLYFHIICSYIKSKINSLNERLIEMKRRKRFIRIRETLQSFDSLYSEINEYNTTFWSKCLLVMWFCFGFAIISLITTILFNSLPFIVLLIIIYCLFLKTFVFLFIIFTASSVNLLCEQILQNTEFIVYIIF